MRKLFSELKSKLPDLRVEGGQKRLCFSLQSVFVVFCITNFLTRTFMEASVVLTKSANTPNNEPEISSMSLHSRRAMAS